MPRQCGLTGTRAQSGNKVSHSNRKTPKSFMPNLQRVTVISDALGRGVPLRITAATLRTIDHNGGLDSYLLTTSDTKLTEEGQRLKRRIKKAVKAKAAA